MIATLMKMMKNKIDIPTGRTRACVGRSNRSILKKMWKLCNK